MGFVFGTVRAARLFDACRSSGQSGEIRATDPTGAYEAVLVRAAYGGAAGGVESCVYIVQKGKAINSHNGLPVLKAGTLDGAKLIWSHPHLLEVQYDTALIESFRNTWSLDEVQHVGAHGEADYSVEIRLAPSSTSGFSILTPEGGFRRSY
jgi:hypothetical protein